MKINFLIDKEHLSPEDVRNIYNHTDKCVTYGNTPWAIEEDEYCVCGKARDDSFDMEKYLRGVGIKDGHISWDLFDV